MIIRPRAARPLMYHERAGARGPEDHDFSRLLHGARMNGSAFSNLAAVLPAKTEPRRA